MRSIFGCFQRRFFSHCILLDDLFLRSTWESKQFLQQLLVDLSIKACTNLKKLAARLSNLRSSCRFWRRRPQSNHPRYNSKDLMPRPPRYYWLYKSSNQIRLSYGPSVIRVGATRKFQGLLKDLRERVPRLYRISRIECQYMYRKRAY